MYKHKLKQKSEMKSQVFRAIRVAFLRPHRAVWPQRQTSHNRGWLRLLYGAYKLKIIGAIAIVAVMVLSPLFGDTGFAASIGPNNPTAATTAVGAGATNWTSPTNIFTSNGAAASVTLAAGATSYNLNATGFGFNINTAATIDGVMVEVQKSSPTVARSSMQDAGVYLTKANAQSGTNQASAATWNTTATYAVYGSSTSLWGTTLTPSDVNNTGFGAQFSAINVKSSGAGASNSASVDHIRITVYYTIPVTYTQSSYRVFNNQDSAVQSTASFAARVNYGTGSAPISTVAADFNGDAKIDLAVANSNSASCSVLINNGDGTFATNVDYTVGTTPYGVAAADFNSDGSVDIATVSSAGILSVLMNNGNGTFATKVDYTTGAAPRAITAADFNSDGKIDVATANSSDNTTSVLLNNGNGTFATKVDYATGTSPQHLAAADFNSDGKVDLAVTNNTANTVSVLTGTGTGTFNAKVDYATGTGPQAVAAADLNGDSKPDLAVINSTAASFSVLLNTGTGTFGTKSDFTTGSGPQFIALGDLNNDNKVDAVTANFSANTLSVLIGNGDGTFAVKADMSATTGPRALSIADLNQDGKLDITAALNSSSTVTVFMNNTSGAMNVAGAIAAQNTAATTPGDQQAFRLRMTVAIGTADLTAGGQLFRLQYAPMTTSCDTGFTNTTAAAYQNVTDVSTIRYFDNPLAGNGAALTVNANDPTDGVNTTANGGVVPQTYVEKGATTFTNTSLISAGKAGMWDFALSSNQTLAGQHYCIRIVASSGTALNTYSAVAEVVMPPAGYKQAAYRWYGNSNGTASQTASKLDNTIGVNAYGLASADFNSDGKLDVVTANSGSTVSVLMGNGNGTFAVKVDYTVGSGPLAVTAADFNADGQPDIVSVNSSSNTASVLLNNGNGTFAAKVDYTVGTGPRSVTYADVNTDGSMDLIAANASASTVSVLLNNGNGTFAAKVDYATGGPAYSVVAADFNGDNKPDLAVANNSAQTTSVLLNNGNGTFATKVDYSSADVQYAVTAGDFNGDSKPDLAVANATSSVSVFMNNGSGAFATKIDYAAPNGSTPVGIDRGDFNGDGKLDLVVANSDSPTVSLYMNNGNGAFPTRTDYATGVNPRSVIMRDFTGDGRLDVAVGNVGDGTQTVLVNASTGPIGSPSAASNKTAGIVGVNQVARLRLNIALSGSGIVQSGQAFKLQYAVKGASCAVSFYNDVTSTSPLQWYANPNITNGSPIGASATDPTDGTTANSPQTYNSANNFTNVSSNVYVGQSGMWDFGLVFASSVRPGTTICLRAVLGDGTLLSSYTVYPEIQYGPQMTQLMRGGKWFSAAGAQQNYFIVKP